MGKIFATMGILGFAAALGMADAFLVEGGPPWRSPEGDDAPPSAPAQVYDQGTPDQPPEGSAEPTHPPNAVPKRSGVPVRETVLAQGYTTMDTNELSILRTVVPQQEATVEAVVLLKDGDRAGWMAWVESPRVKDYYLALKETLHTSFSPEVRDLLDETQRIPGKPVRNLLTFLDPGISSERLVFLRVRERLYEFHVAPGEDAALFALIEVLTQ